MGSQHFGREEGPLIGAYLQLSRMGFRRNSAYRWAHMVNNIASALFGFLYISLWQAVTAGEQRFPPYTPALITQIMVLAQVLAWVSIFLPAGLGIHRAVRTGQIALEMARPLPYWAQVMAREAGNLLHQALFRSLPLAGLFALTVGFPAPASCRHLLLFLPSAALAGYVALTLFYTVGLASLWTTEIRWAHWLYHTLVPLLSGGWIPADLLPGVLGEVAPYLPFAAQLHYPIRIYLGLAGAEGLALQALWALLLTLWCRWLTARALDRTQIQGG